MADWLDVSYNVAVFISTLFLLEFGADKFMDHTAVVARRTGIPDTVIALVTAGAEWEELIVIVASLAQGRASLAVGNTVGSAISNILGAFSLGLLFYPRDGLAGYDRSSRIYSMCLLVATTMIVPVIYFRHDLVWLIGGAILIGLFVIYLVSIGWAIGKGVLAAPEDSDSDSDSSSDTSDDERDISPVGPTTPLLGSAQRDLLSAQVHTDYDCDEPPQRQHEGSRLVSDTPVRGSPRRKSLSYHVGHLIFGFLAICLAGFILSHAAINITDAIGISDELFGVVILSIATTLPEKFIAVMSGSRAQKGILIANSVGSNIFLLTLCLGIILLNTAGVLNGGGVNLAELSVLWGCTLAFTMTVWLGGAFDRWIGGAMLFSYAAFICLEFAVVRRTDTHP